MAESTLSLGFIDFQEEVGFLLGYGRTVANWSATQLAEIAVCVQSGIRRVYNPMGGGGYQWSFLRPSATLYLGASGTDGVLSSGTFDSATFTNWTTQGITTADQVFITAPAVSEGTYDITLVAAGAITLTQTPDDATGLTFRIKRSPANFDLPDDFGRLLGVLHYAADENKPAIVRVAESRILEHRAWSDQNSHPYWAAFRYLTSTGLTGQRQEIIFYPEPDASYTLSYSYEAYSGILTTDLPYPLGGSHLSELYLESCLAVAEQRINGEAGLHTQMFQPLLDDAMAIDKKHGARFFGSLGGREREFSWDEWTRGRALGADGAHSVTYKGVEI